MKQVEAGNRVFAQMKDGVEVTGRVMEMRDGGKALVARDDGKPSEVLAVGKLRRKVGRPTGAMREPMTPPPVDFARVMRAAVEAAMAEQQLTWDALAARAGLSRTTISRVIAHNGEGQRVCTVEAIAKALGLSPSAFWTVNKA